MTWLPFYLFYINLFFSFIAILSGRLELLVKENVHLHISDHLDLLLVHVKSVHIDQVCLRYLFFICFVVGFLHPLKYSFHMGTENHCWWEWYHTVFWNKKCSFALRRHLWSPENVFEICGLGCCQIHGVCKAQGHIYHRCGLCWSTKPVSCIS